MTTVVTVPLVSTVVTVEETGQAVVSEPAGPVTVISAAGQPGLTGPSGAGVASYPFTTPAATWTVSHGLGRYPLVQLLDASGAQIDADIDYPDVNMIVATHAAPLAGTALIT